MYEEGEPPLCAELSTPSGDTSRVSMVKFGVPGLPFESGLFPIWATSSIDARFLAKLDLGAGTCRSISVEKRTRGASLEDSCDEVGRDVLSTAEVREAGTLSPVVSRGFSIA